MRLSPHEAARVQFTVGGADCEQVDASGQRPHIEDDAAIVKDGAQLPAVHRGAHCIVDQHGLHLALHSHRQLAAGGVGIEKCTCVFCRNEYGIQCIVFITLFYFSFSIRNNIYLELRFHPSPITVL